MSTTHFIPLLRERSATRRGFTYVEVMISVGLMSVVMSAFVMALERGSDSFITGCAKGVLSAGIESALDTMAADLREASQNLVATSTTDLPKGQCAVILPSARDSGGTFRVTSSYEPSWQAVVIYCPYVTSGGVSQLRRYVYYDSGHKFPFKFDGEHPITEDYIYLKDEDENELTVDRKSGNASLPAGREFHVLCPGITGLDVDTAGKDGDRTTLVTVRAGCRARGQVTLESEGKRHVAHRN